MRYLFQRSATDEIFSIDSTKSATEDYGAEVTEHPVETGFSITDHVFLKNTQIQIQGVFGEYNFYNPATSDYKTVVFYNEITGEFSGGYESVGHVQRMRQILRNMRDNRELFTLTIAQDVGVNAGDFEVFFNCVIANLNFSASEGSGDTLAVTMTITPIRTAVTQTEAVTKKPERLKPNDPPKDANGNVVGSAVGISDTDQIIADNKPSAPHSDPEGSLVTKAAIALDKNAIQSSAEVQAISAKIDAYNSVLGNK